VFVDGDELESLEEDRVGITTSRHCLVDGGIAKELESLGLTRLFVGDVIVVMRDESQVTLSWKYLSAVRTHPADVPEPDRLALPERL
jgi:hypothetical protein